MDYFLIAIYILIATIIFFTTLSIVKTWSRAPQSTTKSTKEETIPHKKSTNSMKLTRHDTRFIVPHLARGLRDQIHFWVVKVPLTPFRSPLKVFPKISIPRFIVYNNLSPVRNQGDCGSCWAFALCDMLADRMSIRSLGVFDYSLSVQELLACFNPDGCNGGSPEEAAIWLSESGKKLMLNNTYPYKQGSGGLVTSLCPIDRGDMLVGVERNSVFSIVEYIEEDNPDTKILEQNVLNMKQALVDSGPFYCAMTVYDDLFTYKGTQPYKRDKNARIVGGHAIEVIGFCEKGEDPRKEYKDTGYWICRNSWGKDWPLNSTSTGFFTIVMGSNMCGIESRCGYATPMLYGELPKKTQKSIDDLRTTSITQYI